MPSTTQPKYRKDYQPADFLIDRVDLTFDIHTTETLIYSRLMVSRHPDAAPQSALVLDGSAELVSLALDGEKLASDAYVLDQKAETLTICNVPNDGFVLEVETRVEPQNNTSLMGLYASNGNLFTQCEPEGFRKITYYLDRPDVMARFSTTLIADRQQYPVLLSNGNQVGAGQKDKKRHWVKWVDPHRKPAYLFAVVAGRLAVQKDVFLSRSGRKIQLEIYVEPHDLDKVAHAMASLKRAMQWDETRFGLEYDLDSYMIVAVSDFNMGAMENKGLNIFNTKYVLANPATATDADFEAVEGVIGHEYFHNWTGNRVTCRDWFQLSLKEGLTVFRDQEFTADMTSRAVKRIEDVRHLRAFQFPEDAGPTAHPIRPDAYIEMNNFYTMTVYEKGAEVVRMYHTLFGEQGFRKGMDLYFRRHDGHAVTCDDFRQAMADANQVDLTQFELWYSQAGTPKLNVSMHYSELAQSVTLTLSQSCPDTPDQKNKQPFLIPVAVGLLGADGQDLPLQLASEAQVGATTRVLALRERTQDFTFLNVPVRPVPSLLRHFSAPVELVYHYTDEELAFLFMHDSDLFARWEAGQALARRVLTQRIRALSCGENPPEIDGLVGAYQTLLEDSSIDPAFKALALVLPTESELLEMFDGMSPDWICLAVHQVREVLSSRLRHQWFAVWRALAKEVRPFQHEDAGLRSLKNVCLSFMAVTSDPAAIECAHKQYLQADNMTDQFAALYALRDVSGEIRDSLYADFAERWAGEALVMDKWFALHAGSYLPDTLARVKTLLTHPAFSLRNPNKARALLGSFGRNFVHFHAQDGSGYQFLAEQIIEIDGFNPQVASRLVSLFNRWRKLDAPRQAQIHAILNTIASQPNLSRDVAEIVGKSLSSDVEEGALR